MSQSQSEEAIRTPNRKPWLTALKVVCWVVAALIVVAACLVGGFIAYLTPQRIVEIIEEKSDEYLQADVKIGRLDYKIWKTYPWLYFEVDSLEIISKSLDDLPLQQKKQLPVYADSLASVEKVKGKINIHALLKDEIMLREIEIVKPAANIVMVSDSVANFNILKKELPKMEKMPEINLSEIKIVSPVEFNFFSLAQDVEANLDIKNFFLAKESPDSYKIGFDGYTAAKYGEYELPQAIPLKFSTDITPLKDDLKVRLDNLNLSCGNIDLEVRGDLEAHADGIDLNSLFLTANISDVFDVMQYLPTPIANKVKIPEGIEGDVPLMLTLNLLSPYNVNKEKFKNFNLSNLPKFSAVVKISDGKLDLTPPNGKKIEADDIYLIAECNFDPFESENTTLSIAELRVKGEGISLEGMAHISNLTGEQQAFNGNVNFESPLMESLAYFLPSSPVKVAGTLKGNVSVAGNIIDLGKNGITDLAFSGGMASNSLNITSGKTGNVKISNMKTDFVGSLPAYPIKSYQGTKLGFDFTADSFTSKGMGANVSMSKFKVSLDAADTVSGNPDPYGTLEVRAGSVNAKMPGNRFNASNLSLSASGSLNPSGTPNYSAVDETSGGNDALIASRINHTPLVLEYTGGGILQTIMGMVNLDADIKIEKGNFLSSSYLYPIEFAGVDLSTNLNQLKLTASNIRMARSGFAITAAIDGLKPFLTSFEATPLQASADIRFSNVDINQLSWGYYGALLKQGVPYDSVFFVPPMTPLTATDSICVAIPRNIDANIRLYSDAAEYFQYRFAPLSTDIIIKDGDATLNKLTVGTPYCTALVDWTYSTARLDNIYMNLHADIDDFVFANFYPVFPQLIDKIPELKDFTGVLNASIGCRFNMFPDMFMNSSSLEGQFNIKGTDLQFARQGKIERITHLMLIEGSEPIKLQNLNITGYYHDNLLQVNPFRVNFDDYQLQFAGINNALGDMYYHIALEKSPFHLPFGVTLKGKFSHPEVRMGGTHINNKEAEQVAAELGSNININIMAYLRNGWQMFIQQAAKYEGAQGGK